MSERRPAGPRVPTARGSADLAGRSARDWCPAGSAPKPGRRLTAPKGGARPEREALRCACGSCSIQIRRRPTLDQQVGSPARTARRQTHQSDIVIHAFTLHPSGYITQQERSRTRRPCGYGRGPGDPPGGGLAERPVRPLNPNAELRRPKEGRDPKSEDLTLWLAAAMRFGSAFEADVFTREDTRRVESKPTARRDELRESPIGTDS